MSDSRKKPARQGHRAGADRAAREPAPAHALKLKEKVDRGERLSDFDTQFLKRAMQEGREARTLAAKLPQYQEVVNRMAALYA
jgi:hypothetical protein